MKIFFIERMVVEPNVKLLKPITSVCFFFFYSKKFGILKQRPTINGFDRITLRILCQWMREFESVLTPKGRSNLVRGKKSKIYQSLERFIIFSDSHKLIKSFPIVVVGESAGCGQ